MIRPETMEEERDRLREQLAEAQAQVAMLLDTRGDA